MVERFLQALIWRSKVPWDHVVDGSRAFYRFPAPIRMPAAYPLVSFLDAFARVWTDACLAPLSHRYALYCRPNSFFYQNRSIWRCMARNTRFGRVDCSQASNFRSSGTLHGGRTILPSQLRLLDPWAVILRAPARSFSFALLLARHIVPPTATLPVLVSASVQALPSSHPARHVGKIPMIPSPKRVELLPCASYDDPRKPR